MNINCILTNRSLEFDSHQRTEVAFRIQIREIVTRKTLHIFGIISHRSQIFHISGIFTFTRQPNILPLKQTTYLYMETVKGLGRDLRGVL